MSNSKKEEALSNSLSKLESCLETPVVPGELPTWIGEASAAIAEVGANLRRQIETEHEQAFGQITAQDAELIRRVEQMKREDMALIESHQQLLERAANLSERAAEETPRSVLREEDVSPLVEEGLSLVIRVRTQEQALTTWLIEAFNRDRGIAD